MVSVNMVDPIEPGRAAENCIALFGSMQAGYTETRALGFSPVDTYYGFARIWSPDQKEIWARPVDMTAGGVWTTMTYYPFREANRRVGNKFTVMKQLPLMIDYNNTGNNYAFFGYAKGQIFVQPMLYSMGIYNYTPTNNCNRLMFPISLNSNKDYLYLDNGICIPWAGIGPSFP
jgi:hypothetical protein